MVDLSIAMLNYQRVTGRALEPAMAMPFLWLGSSIRRHDHHHLNATAFLIETKALESLVFSWKSGQQLRLPSGVDAW